jgi:hypothetical protein
MKCDKNQNDVMRRVAKREDENNAGNESASQYKLFSDLIPSVIFFTPLKTKTA